MPIDKPRRSQKEEEATPDSIPEKESRIKLGPRSFYSARKISLNNYDPNKKFETEDYGVVHDSFEEGDVLVRAKVDSRIQELRGIKEVKTKE